MPSTLRNVNYQGPFGNTLLHGAVVSGDLNEVERLLARGADPTIVNRDGKTALDAAALFGHCDILKRLKVLPDEVDHRQHEAQRQHDLGEAA